jgi:protein phosphatase
MEATAETMNEITAEYAAEALASAPALEVRTRVTVACKTDLGRIRENNEDKFEFYMPEDEAALAAKGMVFLVCDGMGGHAAGQIASELACKTFIDVYLSHPSSDAFVALDTAAKAANRYILEESRAIPARRGMGTTLSGLVLLGDRAITVQVGDSRVYRFRGGELTQLTLDHGLVDEAIRRGELPPEAAQTHPQRHVLTRALGVEDGLLTDIESQPFEPGDQYLLCSDGLVNHVPDDLIAETLEQYGPGEAAWRLVGKALVDGGSDNCTVLIVRVDSIERLSNLG